MTPLKPIAKFCSTIFLISAISVVPLISQAKDLFITDDYLKGLSDEVSSPEYLEKAEQELLATEKHENSANHNKADIQDALVSINNFETLIRTQFPSSHFIYSMLPTSSRILIFEKFKKTKMLSTAKHMIIEQYKSQQ